MVRRGSSIYGPFNKAFDNCESFNQKKSEQNEGQILIGDIAVNRCLFRRV
jgi:hypothetical protein